MLERVSSPAKPWSRITRVDWTVRGTFLTHELLTVTVSAKSAIKTLNEEFQMPEYLVSSMHNGHQAT